MDPLDFLTDEELITFFHCKKTEISCVEEPHIFLNQLRDHNLVPEDLYQKVRRMKSKERIRKGVYEILDWLENEQGQCVRLFWRCVFQDHILQKYPALRLLQKSLRDGSFKSYENLPNAEKPSCNKEIEREEKKREQKKGPTKRRKSGEERDEEDPGPSSVSSQKKPTKKPTFSPLLKRGLLPITCGDNKGTLYAEKLAKGDKCILSQDRWFTANEFERFSGREKSKNWKRSIHFQNTPLQKLIEAGHLQCRHTTASGRKRVKFAVYMESSSPDESSDDSEEWIEEEEDSEREEEEEGSETVDLSVFQVSSLPVSCGSFSGKLYKKRFAGSRSKSIRTEERWFTPEEFVKQESSLRDGHWKKHILCHGKTLYYLVQEKILHIHSLQCCCHLCRPENKQDEDNDDVCYTCDSEGNLVCCDECPRAFHYHCHLPVIEEDTLGDDWMCTYCVLKTNENLWIHMSRKDALSSPVSENLLRCQYLLLFLYKMVQSVFNSDSAQRVERHSSVISNPMWLGNVKTKLQEDGYRTVGQFERDIKLIFNNWQTFNRDNQHGKMGAEVMKKFEKEFTTVFKIQ